MRVVVDNLVRISPKLDSFYLRRKKMRAKTIIIIILFALLLTSCDNDRFWTAEDKNSDRHYTNSKKACDEALGLIIKVGDVSQLGPQQSQEVIDLLKLAIAEANMVSDSFLKKVHPVFYKKYTQEYKRGLQMLLDGLESKNQAYILGGSYGYNEFAEWTKANANNLKFPD